MGKLYCLKLPHEGVKSRIDYFHTFAVIEKDIQRHTVLHYTSYCLMNNVEPASEALLGAWEFYIDLLIRAHILQLSEQESDNN